MFIKTKSLVEGKEIHVHIIIIGHFGKVNPGTKNVNLYAAHVNMGDVHLIFDKLEKQNLTLWNIMIKGYVKIGKYEGALELYYQMHKTSLLRDKITFTSMLKACAGLLVLWEEKGIHDHIVDGGLYMDLFVGSALIDMFTKCGYIEDARQVFDKMWTRDVVSWSAMIAEYGQSGHGEKDLALCDQLYK